MCEKDHSQWRHSRREAFSSRSSSAPQRWRDVPCPTVGSFMVENRLEEVLMGVVPSDLPLSQFCSLTEEDLRTKFSVEDTEKVRHVMTVIQLAKEFDVSGRVERTASSPTISPKPCEYDDLLCLFPRKPRPISRQISEDARIRRESFGSSPHAQQHSPQVESSNLLRMRASLMGQSAPSLSACMKELGPPRRGRAARKSFICNTSPTLPRCNSPILQGIPSESLRNVSTSSHGIGASVKRVDGRRWSLASLPSSGYGTNTPGSSNVSSQCSSQEKLHTLTHANVDDVHSSHTHFSSNESNPGLEEDGRHSPVVRPRSRSLSPLRSPGVDSETVAMNNVYKERFPKATQQMEEKLHQFLNDNRNYDPSDSLDAVGRFVHHQVIQMAEDCLCQSQNQIISSQYFFEMSESLEKLLAECIEKAPEAVQYLRGLIKKLLVIISRPARLLECLEFDPEEFYRLLEVAEGHAKIQQVTTDIPKYIISKLGLNRDPLAGLSLSNDFEPLEQTDFSSKSGRELFPKSKPPSESDFENVKLISNGAYGAVYLVRHIKSRLRFAMKKINKHNLMLRNQVEQAFAERDIMSFTDNPFVVSMFCSFETKKHLCMVMEYVEGGDCATLLKNMGPLPVDLARFYFAETVLAVEYLHSYGIVHRDLKPDNLLITSMGHIKLTDFGLSKVGLMNLATNLYEGYVDRETKQFTDKQVYGTPEYIAPEVILRQGYGKPVDWWSMGIILYECLVGCVPFFGETPEELFAHVINDEIEWPASNEWPATDDAKELISLLLQQNPRERLGTGGAHEVKEHQFFDEIDWRCILRQKAEFVPQLDSEDDTSYFDTRTDRYSHELEDSEDLEDPDESSLFSSFSSCSPRFRKVYSRVERELEEEHMLQHTKEEYRKFTRSDSNTSDHSDSPNSLMGSLAETPEDVGSKDVFLPFNATGKSLSTSLCNLDSERHFAVSKLSYTSGPKDSLPRFSISTDCDVMTEDHKELSPVEETDAKVSPQAVHPPTTGRIYIPPISPMTKQSPRSVIKSASVSGLSLIIPTDEFGPPPIGSPGGSSTSSRDTSPSRELSPLVAQLKPPIIIRKGARGYGFTIRAIRVYYGDSDVYTVHHLIMAVESNSPAFESGLRPGDLITHINGEPTQGLLHHQVLHLILSGGDRINIRTIPLDSTTIKSGGRKRNPSAIKMAKRPYSCRRRSAQVKRDTHSDKKRRASLLRRLSSKRASAEIHQVAGSSPVLTPSRSFQSLTRSLTAADSLPASPTRTKSSSGSSPRSPPTARGLLHSLSDSPPSTSSQSSSPSSSTPNSPASSTHLPHFPRPSSLHGLKHKLTQTFHSPRRKSVGHIPLSPLARTPSPSPVQSTSPTRSPSPLAFPVHHAGHPMHGMAQTFQILKSSTVVPLSATICSSAKKSFMRPKSAEPSSPLLRRALSPDRLHPKSAEVKAKRESFSGQASPLALSSSPSPRSQYLSSTKLSMTSQRSSYAISGVGKSLNDLPDATGEYSLFQEYEGGCTTPKSRLEGRISRPAVSQMRKRGEKPIKSLLSQQLFKADQESHKEQVAFAEKSLAPSTPDIEITRCSLSIDSDDEVPAPIGLNKERRERSISTPTPMTSFNFETVKWHAPAQNSSQNVTTGAACDSRKAATVAPSSKDSVSVSEAKSVKNLIAVAEAKSVKETITGLEDKGAKDSVAVAKCAKDSVAVAKSSKDSVDIAKSSKDSVAVAKDSFAEAKCSKDMVAVAEAQSVKDSVIEVNSTKELVTTTEAKVVKVAVTETKTDLPLHGNDSKSKLESKVAVSHKPKLGDIVSSGSLEAKVKNLKEFADISKPCSLIDAQMEQALMEKAKPNTDKPSSKNSTLPTVPTILSNTSTEPKKPAASRKMATVEKPVIAAEDVKKSEEKSKLFSSSAEIKLSKSKVDAKSETKSSCSKCESKSAPEVTKKEQKAVPEASKKEPKSTTEVSKKEQKLDSAKKASDKKKPEKE